jgi:tRNA G10  N-methylase Trm11
MILLMLMIASSSAFRSTPSFVRDIRMYSQRTNLKSTWQPYLVEFRNLAPTLRWDELRDAAEREGVPELLQCAHNGIADARSQLPITVCVKLPDDDACRRIVKSSATIRRIVSVWGEGDTHDQLYEQLVANRDMYATYVHSEKTWRVQFDRYGREGRSGLNSKEKHAIIDRMVPPDMQGKVTIKSPELDLIFLEDCSTYHALCNAFKNAKLKAKSSQVPIGDNPEAAQQPSTPADPDMCYTPVRYVFGRVIAEGPKIESMFALPARPFVGTTSMKAVCAHVSASAAQVKPGQRVLDPFCGTGSLLVAAAYLGKCTSPKSVKPHHYLRYLCRRRRRCWQRY